MTCFDVASSIRPALDGGAAGGRGGGDDLEDDFADDLGDAAGRVGTAVGGAVGPGRHCPPRHRHAGNRHFLSHVASYDVASGVWG